MSGRSPAPSSSWFRGTGSSPSPQLIRIILASLCLLITLSFLFPARSIVPGPGPGPNPHPPRCIRNKLVLTTPQTRPPQPVTNILITGGAGYIGSHFTLLLLDQPRETRYNIVLIDDLSRGDIRNVERLRKLVPEYHTLYFYKADVGDTPLLTKVMKKHNIEVVIHFAGYAYASESITYPLTYYDNTVTKTQHLLEAIDKAGIKRLVYSSSSATYGTVEDPVCDIPITETSPQVPVSPYGQSKLFSEHIIRAYAVSKHKQGQPFSFALLRYFNVIGADPKARVGPMPKAKFADFGRIVDGCFKAVLDKSSSMKVYGQDYNTPDGTAIRDYIHVSDLVDAHLKVVSGVHGNQELVYNVGIGKGSSNKELVEACSVATGEKVPVEYAPRRDGDPPVVIGEAVRIVKDLGWQPKHLVLSESVKTAWVWRQKIADEMIAPDPSGDAKGDDPDAPLGVHGQTKKAAQASSPDTETADKDTEDVATRDQRARSENQRASPPKSGNRLKKSAREKMTGGKKNGVKQVSEAQAEGK